MAELGGGGMSLSTWPLYMANLGSSAWWLDLKGECSLRPVCLCLSSPCPHHSYLGPLGVGHGVRVGGD